MNTQKQGRGKNKNPPSPDCQPSTQQHSDELYANSITEKRKASEKFSLAPLLLACLLY